MVCLRRGRETSSISEATCLKPDVQVRNYSSTPARRRRKTVSKSAASHSSFHAASSARHWVAIDVVCIAAYSLFLVDAIAVGVNASPLATAVKVQSLQFYPFLFCIPGLIIGVVVGRMRLKGVPHLFIGLSTVYFLCRQFRGAWIWGGTFDKYGEPMVTWLSPLLIGSLVGYLAGLAAPLVSSEFEHSPKRTCIHVSALLITGFGVWVLTALYPNDSFFPPSRIVGHFSLAALVLVASYWLRTEQQHETRF